MIKVILSSSKSKFSQVQNIPARSFFNMGSAQSEFPSESAKHTVLGTPYHDKVPIPDDHEEIVFGMGCFWGVERKFWKQPGVYSTSVGYAGGNTKEGVNYREICTGRTNHAEVCRVVYKNDEPTLKHLMKTFWESHDPTTLNHIHVYFSVSAT